MTACPCGLDGPCDDVRCDARRYECDTCERRWSSQIAAQRCCDHLDDATD